MGSKKSESFSSLALSTVIIRLIIINIDNFIVKHNSIIINFIQKEQKIF